jgi:cation:H+ antiporter
MMEDTAMTALLVFVLAGVVIVAAGTSLARSADDIAEASRLGHLWVGSVLLAGATSLPELITDISAVRLGAVDLAVGDLFGSSMANMLILAVLDAVSRRRQVLQQAALDHALAASLALALNAAAAALVFLRPDFTVLRVSPASFGLFLLYLAGSRAVYRNAARFPLVPAPDPTHPGTPRPTLRRALLKFGVASLAILAVAPAFAWAAKQISVQTGLGETFVGTWLVGMSTSLPEFVASFAAVRMGSFDMAVGNLFGSNAFNMAILLALDLAQPGSLWTVVDSGHVLSALIGIVLMALGIAAIMYRAERRFALVEPDSLAMLLTYALGLWVLYKAAG